MKKVLFIALSIVILAGCGSVSTVNTTDVTSPFYNMVFIPEGNIKNGLQSGSQWRILLPA